MVLAAEEAFQEVVPVDAGKIKKIENIFGKKLVSLTEFGLSDLSGRRKQLLVLKDIGLSELGAIKKSGFVGTNSFVMSEKEFLESQDVFALFFAEYLVEPVVLLGKDLSKKVRLEKKIVRHEVEKAVRTSLAGFRHAFLQTGFFGKKNLLDFASTEIEPIVLGLLFLKGEKGEKAGSTKNGLEKVEKIFGIKNSLFKAVYASNKPVQEKLETVYGFLKELSEKVN